jgi:N utilization substance protein B
MKKGKHPYSISREFAFSFLYYFNSQSKDELSSDLEENLQTFKDSYVSPGDNEMMAEISLESEQFAIRLIGLVLKNQESYDENIQKLAHRKVDPFARSALSLGLCEIKEIGTAKAIVINEMVDLMKKYSTEESSHFVNGVLDKLC